MNADVKHRVAVAIQTVLWGVQYAAIVVHAAATALEDGLYEAGWMRLGPPRPISSRRNPPPGCPRRWTGSSLGWRPSR
jgi:hypothetical protein